MAIELVKRKIPEKFGFGPDDIQVLSPMRRDRDPIRSTVLNTRLQDALNPNGEKAASGSESKFRIGDQIMQIRNNCEKDILKENIGTVTTKLSGDYENETVMEAEFDGRPSGSDRKTTMFSSCRMPARFASPRAPSILSSSSLSTQANT